MKHSECNLPCSETIVFWRKIQAFDLYLLKREETEEKNSWLQIFHNMHTYTHMFLYEYILIKYIIYVVLFFVHFTDMLLSALHI